VSVGNTAGTTQEHTTLMDTYNEAWTNQDEAEHRRMDDDDRRERETLAAQQQPGWW
jgi:hypothetical protein